MDDPTVFNSELARLIKQQSLRGQGSLQPRAKRGRRPLDPNDQNSENFRLIRGKSYGAQTGAFILINNVVVLSGGLDPTNGDPTLTVRVANLFIQNFTNGQYVDAAYSPAFSVSPACDWETLAGNSSGTEKYRLISGIAYTAGATGSTTFLVNTIALLSGTLDPRVTPGDPTETLSIHKRQNECIPTGTPITAVYNVDLEVWDLVTVERYRAIRGKWYSGTSTLTVDHIVVLDSGLDPRTDTTSDTETVSVSNRVGDTYGSGEDVWADYNAKDGVWEARPKAGSGKLAATVRVTADVPAADDSGGPRSPGISPSYDVIDGDTGGNDLYNHSLKTVTNGSYAVVVENDDGHMVIYNAWC